VTPGRLPLFCPVTRGVIFSLAELALQTIADGLLSGFAVRTGDGSPLYLLRTRGCGWPSSPLGMQMLLCFRPPGFSARLTVGRRDTECGRRLVPQQRETPANRAVSSVGVDGGQHFLESRWPHWCQHYGQNVSRHCCGARDDRDGSYSTCREQSQTAAGICRSD